MHRWAGLIGLGLLSACQPAAAPERFDLVCTVRSYSRPQYAELGQGLGEPLATETMRFTFDLERDRWCFTDGCNEAEMSPIDSVTESTITIMRDMEFSRVNGMLTADGESGFIRHGECERADYTRPARRQF